MRISIEHGMYIPFSITRRQQLRMKDIIILVCSHCIETSLNTLYTWISRLGITMQRLIIHKLSELAFLLLRQHRFAIRLYFFLGAILGQINSLLQLIRS